MRTKKTAKIAATRKPTPAATAKPKAASTTKAASRSTKKAAATPTRKSKAAAAPPAATCASNCQTGQSDAITYMNSEILWATIFTQAWQNAAVMEQLQDAQRAFDGGDTDAVNNVLTSLASGLGLPPPVFPNDVKTRISFDSPEVVTLILPPVQNIPPSPLDMVPHAL